MVCYHPVSCYRALGAVGSPIRFGKAPIGAYRSFAVACGQCVGCRLEKSRQWAVRCMHEAKSHEDNCFITLTYSDKCLPPGGTLVLEHHQGFMKRLRERIGRVEKHGRIKFYMCGEYGEKTARPHYHYCIFGYDFADKKYVADGPDGDKYYESKSLSSLWTFGNHMLGEVTFKSAAYVARYVMKKVTGDVADDYYRWTDSDGVVWDLLPEFTSMSRNGGIGLGHIHKFMDDVYPSDFLIVNGKKARPPRFYDKIYELSDPEGFEALKVRRVRNAKKYADNNTPERREVREFIANDRLARLKRGM